ncbi:MAG: PASTA domain-containing protein [Ruminococcus sp.]|nr:PASTA domain-containing protein [Ruminococcus sp.]
MANNNPTNSMRFRAKFVMTAVFMVLFGGVAVNFFRISVLNNKKYQAMANDRHFGSITISAHRGSIFDCNGVTLAKSATVYKVILDPSCLRDEMKDLEKRIAKRNSDKQSGNYVPEYDEEGKEKNVLPASVEEFRNQTIDLLCKKLNIKPTVVTEAMEKDTQYVVLQTQVEKQVADELISYFNDLNMIALYVTEDTKRYYPQSELAASVIGFTNADGTGLYGIEAKYDEYLSGIDGKTVSAKDSNGNELPYKYAKTYAAKNGDDIYLTINSDVQYILEKNLEKMVNDFNVKNRGCAILMNCKTGAIYGMAQYPSFDLNEPRVISDKSVAAEIEKIKDPDEKNKRMNAEWDFQWRNKNISERIEPGSVFKVITSAAAIEENLVDFEKRYLACSGSVTIPGLTWPIHCHVASTGGQHGMQTFQEALLNSCNPAFIQIGKDLGFDKFVYYCDAFGLGEKTGIDLPAEGRGDPFTSETIDEVNLAYGAFGQGETVTPLELITACCASVNGGYLLEPYVVEKIVDAEGNVVLKNERTVRRQVVSNDTSKKLAKCLEGVVTGNPTANVAIKGYSIGGKSGTAQRKMITAKGEVLDPTQQEDESKEEYCASYMCFTPADDPEYMLIVMADIPDKNIQYYGSKVAVPTAKSIMEEILPLMNILPEYTDEEMKELDVRVPILEGSIDDAVETLKTIGITNYKKIGNGIEVVAQYPVTGTAMNKNGCVYLYTEKNIPVEETTVPQFTYMDLSNVNYLAEEYGVNFAVSGASASAAGATVQSQDIAPGTRVPKGTVVKLVFETPSVDFAD